MPTTKQNGRPALCGSSGGLLAVLAAACVLPVTGAVADARLPRILGDGVVLQRDMPVDIWGWADDGERVEVYLDGVRVGVTEAKGGSFRMPLGTHRAGGPHEIMVVASNRLKIEDAWFGDVWLASGQSNMELPMARVATRFGAEIEAGDNAMIREFAVPKSADFNAPQEDVASGNWLAATAETVPGFSAAGYFFARELNARYGVPIGIIKSAFGGSAAESWMSEEALEDWPQYLGVATSYRDEAYLERLKSEDRAASDAWYSKLAANDAGLAADPAWSQATVDDSDWSEFELPAFWTKPAGAGVAWFRKTIALPESAAGLPATLNLGRIIDADIAWVNGVKVGETGYEWPPRIYPVPENVLKQGDNTIVVRVLSNGRPGGFFRDKDYSLVVGSRRIGLEGAWKVRVGAQSDPAPVPRFVEWRQPLGFYNAMLAPLEKLQLKGVIWYQGETNVGRAAEYAELFPALIADWRSLFGRPDLPFLYVQLASYLEPAAQPTASDWAELRAAQQAALAMPATAMVVALDAGEWNDIHPLDKKTVGERLALAARKVAYGENELVASGPIATSVTRDGAALVIEFEQTGGGLVIDGDRLGGFALAGADGNYRWADARLDGSLVIVSSNAVREPVAVRYAWADNPVNANLYNVEGLPAAPFELRRDDAAEALDEPAE